jgi:hypothetical protein
MESLLRLRAMESVAEIMQIISSVLYMNKKDLHDNPLNVPRSANRIVDIIVILVNGPFYTAA